MARSHLLTLVLIAVFAFGGSFTCSSNSDDDHKVPPKPAPVTQVQQK